MNFTGYFEMRQLSLFDSFPRGVVYFREENGNLAPQGNIAAGGVPLPGYPRERKVKLLPSISRIHYSPSWRRSEVEKKKKFVEEGGPWKMRGKRLGFSETFRISRALDTDGDVK